MAARTPVSICNQALGRIGAEYISSLSEDTSNARHCSVVYDDTLLEMLESDNWAFAVKRGKPAPVSDDTLYPGWDYAYALPNDLVRLVDIEGVSSRKARIEGNTLLCTEKDPILVYISQPESANNFTPLFTQAFALRLAVKLAAAIKKSRQLEQQLLGEFYQVYQQARGREADESTLHEHTEFWAARGSDLSDVRDRLDDG
jgi:hypothetical protein